MIKIGHGIDVHAFGGGQPLILGGVEIKNHIGLVAHSDGDVVLHAVCDSLLGAIGAGDIGTHFPDTSNEYKGVDSRFLLRKVLGLVNDKSATINNLDVTIIAQTPRMISYISAIKECIAEDLSIKVEQINVKATTTERLGFVGRKEGISVHCVCLIDQPIQ